MMQYVLIYLLTLSTLAILYKSADLLYYVQGKLRHTVTMVGRVTKIETFYEHERVEPCSIGILYLEFMYKKRMMRTHGVIIDFMSDDYNVGGFVPITLQGNGVYLENDSVRMSMPCKIRDCMQRITLFITGLFSLLFPLILLYTEFL